MPPEKRDPAYLWDMLGACEAITRLVRGTNFEEFLADEVRLRALERLFEIVGEAAGRVSATTRQAQPRIPWTSVIGMRNVVSHEYDRLDYRKMWDTASRDVPQLVELLRPLIPPPPADTETL
jgi:uncharacterized protein with HEPN domain